MPLELYDNGPRHLFVELETPEAVAALRPDLFRLAALGPMAPVGCMSFGALVFLGWVVGAAPATAARPAPFLELRAEADGGSGEGGAARRSGGRPDPAHLRMRG